MQRLRPTPFRFVQWNQVFFLRLNRVVLVFLLLLVQPQRQPDARASGRYQQPLKSTLGEGRRIAPPAITERTKHIFHLLRSPSPLPAGMLIPRRHKHEIRTLSGRSKNQKGRERAHTTGAESVDQQNGTSSQSGSHARGGMLACL